MIASETEKPSGNTNGRTSGAGDPSTLPPGAERFWGEFAKTRAGRSDRGSGSAGRNDGRGHGQECLEWCPVCRSADLIRTAAPPDVKSQLEAIQGEAFNVLRAFLTAYSEKTSGVWQPTPGSSDQSGPGSRDPEEKGSEETGTDIPIQ